MRKIQPSEADAKTSAKKTVRAISPATVEKLKAENKQLKARVKALEKILKNTSKSIEKALK